MALSNGPAPLIAAMSRNAGIVWDLIIPLELVGSYKPHPDAYRAALKIFPQFQPHQFMMVTANPGFGDLEAAETLGMATKCIRNVDTYECKDIDHLICWLPGANITLTDKD